MPSDRECMDLCIQVSKGSKCKRTKVGALLLGFYGPDNAILRHVAACNGSDLCKEKDCLRANSAPGEDLDNCRGLHAEVRCILNLVSTHGNVLCGTLFCTLSPCGSCARLIIASGIARVVYLNCYTDTTGIKLLEEAGIRVIKLEEETNGIS